MREIQVFCYSPQCECESIFTNYKDNKDLISAYLFDKNDTDGEPHLYLHFNDTIDIHPIAEEIKEKEGVREVRYTKENVLLAANTNI